MTINDDQALEWLDGGGASKAPPKPKTPVANTKKPRTSPPVRRPSFSPQPPHAFYGPFIVFLEVAAALVTICGIYYGWRTWDAIADIGKDASPAAWRTGLAVFLTYAAGSVALLVSAMLGRLLIAIEAKL